MEVLSLVKHATNQLRFFCKSGFIACILKSKHHTDKSYFLVNSLKNVKNKHNKEKKKKQTEVQ